MTTIEISNTWINGLLDESLETGDISTAELCRKALNGDDEARAQCEAIIDEALND